MKAFWSGKAGSDRVEENNWGDVIAPVIIEALSGQVPTNRRKKTGGRLVTVGSLMHRIRPGDHMWGTGMLSPDKVVTPLPPGVVFHAVRGPMTRDVLLGMGADVPAIYGDPALLIPYILKIPEQEITHELGIIPHYCDVQAVQHLASPSVKIIDICGGIEQVIKEVLSCETILASSLHGVILGDAYKKKTAWLRVANATNLIGGDWKFHDYYASTNREAIPTDLTDAGGLPPIRWADQADIDLSPLLQACPFNKFGYRTVTELSGR